MKKHRGVKPARAGIRLRLFAYLLSFVGLMFICLWLFQVVFLDNFYQSVKRKNLFDCYTTISRDLASQDDPENYIAGISMQDSLFVAVYDSENKPQYNTHNSWLFQLSDSELTNLRGAFEDGKAVILDEVYYTGEKQQFRKDGPEDNVPAEPDGKEPQGPEGKTHDEGKNIDSMVVGGYISLPDGSTGTVLIGTFITPMGATARTLQIQLSYIVVIFVLLSGVLAVLLSYKISKPIINITQSAAKLAEGNYSVAFREMGYREIAELAHTLNYAAGELSKVERLRQELIANISHDLRTPLTLIAGYAELMRDIPGENSPENLQVVLQEVNRLSRLVDDVMDLSQLQAGVQKLNLSSFDLGALIGDIVARQNALLAAEGHELLFDSDGDAIVTADESKIGQVVYNLIGNAVTYTGEDKKIYITQKHTGNTVCVSVRDTGKGIDPDLMDHIWERYYKGEKNTSHKRATVGSGLGLSIVKNVLDMHGMDYGADSKPGEGSTFWFTLALAQGDDTPI